MYKTFPFCKNKNNFKHQHMWDVLWKQEGQDGPVSLTWLPDQFLAIGLSVQ